MIDWRDHPAVKRRNQGSVKELLDALKSIRDQTNMVQHSQETRLNDIYDIANAAIEGRHP